MGIVTDHIRSEEQIQKLKNIIFLLEKEKDDIGYEIHENLCQLISASLLHINMAQRTISEKELAFLEEAGHILKEVISGLKIIANNISPINLKTLGFVSIIQNLNTLIKIEKEIDSVILIDEKCISTLSLHIQNTLYQIIQLQLINIIKCTDVKNVEINILTSDDKVKMKIQSDGFCDKESCNINKNGFKNLQDTIEAFGGSFDLSFLNKDRGMLLTVYI
jgi:signal transduction histidine kinase